MAQFYQPDLSGNIDSPFVRARKQGAMLIAIKGLALSLDGRLSRILIMHWDREWTKLELAEGLSQ